MIEYQKKTTNLNNNEQIAYIEKGTGNETILLIHGNLASSVHMVTMMDALSDKYHVIAPDLRGFGDSSFNNDFTSLKELAEDLLLFCEQLNIKSAHVLGWSTGFGVAMELAILNPNLVKSLFSLEGMSVKGYYSKQRSHTIFNSYSEMKNDQQMQFVSNALARNDYDFIKNMWLKTLLIKTNIKDELLDIYVKETLKQRCQMNINWCWVNFNISNESNLYKVGNGTMNQIECPIHLTLALEDNVVTPEMIQENIDRLQNVTVSTYINGSHCLHIDELDNVVDAFIKHISKN